VDQYTLAHSSLYATIDVVGHFGLGMIAKDYTISDFKVNMLSKTGISEPVLGTFAHR
jgi:hypothetical protein